MRKRNWITVIMFCLITLLPLYGNIVTKDGGILDEAILDQANQAVKNEQHAKNLLSKGLKTGDAVPFVLNFPNGLDRNSLKKLIDLAEEVKNEFGDYGQLSLCNAPRYQDTGTSLNNAPHLNKAMIDNPNFQIENWKQAVRNDKAVYGTLIGRNFNYALVTVFLPQGEDEQAFFRRVADFLEQRKINRLEWFIKTDIKPAPQFANVTIAGWAMARGLISAALISDIMKLSAFGLLAVWLFFWLSFLSVRQASISSLLIVLSFIWTRGSIGLIQLLEPYTGFTAYERVYILLIYTTLIVAGISFATRKFEAYNEARETFSGNSHDIWKQTKPVNEILLATGLISIINFATLYQIGVRGILEVGLFSALGLAYLLAFTFWLMPALHILIGGEAVKSKANKFGQAWNVLLEKIATTCFRLAWQGQGKIKRQGLIAIILTITLASAAALIIISDYWPHEKAVKNLEVRTKPLEYIPGTISHRASKILNDKGGYGFDRLSILIEAKAGKSIESPSFIKEAARLQELIAGLDETRQTASVIDLLSNISQESHHKKLPATATEIHDGLYLIEEDFGQQIKEQFWFTSGLVIFTSFAGNDSNVMGEYIDQINSLASNFPTLTVTTFGKLTTYPEADRYIREGKPWNVISSFWLVSLGCSIWVAYRNRKNLSNALLAPFKTGAAIALPFVFASALVAFYMMVCKVPLDQATACITALAVNAAVDFSLYLVADFQTALNDGEDIESALTSALAVKGKVIVMDIILNALCFAPLICSNFTPVSRLGIIMIIMMLACGIGSLILLPMLLPICVTHRKSATT